MSILVRALLGGLVLLFTGSLPGVTAFAQNSSDSADWNDYENYSTSDWGPVVNGVSIRVTAPREITFGFPLRILIERRLSDDSLTKREILWPADSGLVHFRLEIADNDRCPQGGISGSVLKGDTSSREDGIIGEFAIKELPTYCPGEHDFRLRVVVDKSRNGEWCGGVEVDFSQVIGPELAVRRKLVLIMPRYFCVQGDCSAGFDCRQLDTTIVYQRTDREQCLGICDFEYYEVQGLGADTVRIKCPRLGRIAPDLRKRLQSGRNEVLVFVEVREGNCRLLGGEGRVVTLWKRKYDLMVSPEQLKALQSCSN